MAIIATNGKLTSKELKTAFGVQLTPAASDSMGRLRVAFKKEFGKELVVSYGYRSGAVQERIFLSRYDHTPRKGNTYANGGIINWRGRTWHKKAGVAPAAAPYTSNHGLGRAVDLGSGVGSFSSKEYKWMSANAPKYGWTNTEGARIREAWHWVYNSANDKMRPTASTKPAGLKIDGDLGVNTNKEWQRQLGNLKVDGDFGEASVKRLKARLNGKDGHGGFELTGGKLSATGTLDARTIKAVQKLLNIWAERGEFTLVDGALKVDGKLGSRTVKALQKSLNEGLWK